jgi:hypothetical protein
VETVTFRFATDEELAEHPKLRGTEFDAEAWQPIQVDGREFVICPRCRALVDRWDADGSGDGRLQHQGRAHSSFF